MLKREVRVIGIDDSPFEKTSKCNALVVGTVCRGGGYVDGILSTKVRIDGRNATSKIISMINGSKFKSQLQCIFLDGIAMGGFNVIDVHKVYNKTGIPVIVVIRRMPDRELIINTLIRIKMKSKVALIRKAGEVKKIGKIYVQHVGIEESKVAEFIKLCCTQSYIPEPVRLSHLIASGILLGESKGRV